MSEGSGFNEPQVRLALAPQRCSVGTSRGVLPVPELHGARQGAQYLHEPNDPPGRDLRHHARRVEVRRGTLNVILDQMMFDNEDFRDLRVTGVPPGIEPFYSFDASVLQVFVSFWLRASR